MERDLTKGSIGGNIFRFALPYFLSYFLQTLYGMADLFIIGQFDSVAGTTAVSIGSQVMHMITVMIVGIAMGTTVMIGKSVGAKQKKETSKIIGNTITLFLGISVILTAILLFLVNPIVHVMSTPEQAVHGTSAYLMICFAGIPLITAYNIISSFSEDSVIPKVRCILSQSHVSLILFWITYLLEYFILVLLVQRLEQHWHRRSV